MKNNIQAGPKSDQLLQCVLHHQSCLQLVLSQNEDQSSGISVKAADVEIQLPAALQAVSWMTNLLRSRQLTADKSRG